MQVQRTKNSKVHPQINFQQCLSDKEKWNNWLNLTMQNNILTERSNCTHSICHKKRKSWSHKDEDAIRTKKTKGYKQHPWSYLFTFTQVYNSHFYILQYSSSWGNQFNVHCSKNLYTNEYTTRYKIYKMEGCTQCNQQLGWIRLVHQNIARNGGKNPRKQTKSSLEMKFAIRFFSKYDNRPLNREAINQNKTSSA